MRLRLFGEVREGFFGAEMVHPRSPSCAAATAAEGLTPIYPDGRPRAGGAAQVVQHAPDEVPPRIAAGRAAPSCSALIQAKHVRSTTHRPGTVERAAGTLAPGLARLKFDELLAQQLVDARCTTAGATDRGAPRSAASRAHRTRCSTALPFALTGAQQRVLREIAPTSRKSHPMQRLLQGDVGSGKTVVAALAATQAIEAATRRR